MLILRANHRLFLALALVLPLGAGCDSGSARSLPVKGTVAVDGKPLTTGSVTFKPDTTKGNTLGQEPTGSINADGTYTLYTLGKEGAPAGWYTVAVHSGVPSNPKDPYSQPKSLINPRYNDPATSGLSVQVLENPPAGAYDLKLAR